MKCIVIAALLASLNSYSQHADAILGKWLKANKEDLVVEVLRQGGGYMGIVISSKTNEKSRGFIMLENLKYNVKEKIWEGTIHDPKSGRRYDAEVKMQTDGTLEVSGSMFIFKIRRIFRRVTT